ncbi:MAG: SNF2-related protein [Nitrospirota bacterium]|nr:SNF2-related protein [Nitrospirota bacterium]
MTLVKRLRLFFKTKVSGYLTRDGRWVDLHFDKRPTRKPTIAHGPSAVPAESTTDSGLAVPQERSQLNLLSVLDLPSRKRKLFKKPETASTRPDTDIPVSQSDGPEQETQAAEDASTRLDYGRSWDKVSKALPKFGAQETWTPSQRKKANEAAKEILECVDVTTGKDNRPLTAKEQRSRLERLTKSDKVPKNWRTKLAAYSGQGGIGDSLNEYYTPPNVAAAMWNLLSRMGLQTGHVLEPSAGTGVFQETKPHGVKMTAVEWDKTASTVNALLHPDDDVVHSSLEDFVTADMKKYDAVIGNVPFGVRGAIAVSDKPELSTAEQYFLDTALDKTKDGGVVSLIVPHGIATNQTTRVFRQRVMAKAEILAVHRMPNTAFAHSGTGVVTDILVLRKRPQEVAGALGILEKKDLQALGAWDGPWMDAAILDDPARGFLHGTAQTNWRGGVDVGGSMDGIPSKIAQTPITSQPLSLSLEMIQQQVQDRPDLLKKANWAAKKNPYPELANGTTRLINGVLYVLQGEPRRWHKADEIGPGVQYTKDSKEGLALELGQRLKYMADGYASGSDFSKLDIAALRGAVLGYVSAHGNPSGDTVLAEMAARDPRFYPLLVAVDADGQPSSLLRGEMSGRALGVTNTKDFDEVMRILLNGDGRNVSLQDIAVNWTGGTDSDEENHEEIVKKLYGSDRYAMNLDGTMWGTRDDLLSGDLYPKRDAMSIAISAMPDSPVRHKLEQQLAWLDDSLAPKSMEEFEVSLRSGWMPPEILGEFLTSKAYAYGEKNKSDIRYVVDFNDGVYNITNVGQGQGYLNGIYHDYLNRLSMKEKEWNQIVDLEKEFQTWLATSPHRSTIEDLYNRLYNGYRPKRYGMQEVPLPGWNPERTLNAYQHPALRWAIEEGKGIISYDVGLGKTPMAIALVKALKSQGKVQRPLIVVPKSLTANWAAEIEAFAPGSSVLIIGETHTRDKDGKLKARADSPEDRHKKWHQMMQGSYDYVLVTAPAFEEIDVDPITKGEYVNQDFWVKRSKKLDKATPRHVREIQERYQQAMANKDFQKRTNAVYFNDLGIDCLIGDEFHAYKNLFEAHNRFGEKPKFLGGSGFAKRSLDMQHKCKWVRDHNGNRGVFELTATPTKNSPLEIYSMLSHIAPELFEQRGIRNQEEFIDRYCEIEKRQILNSLGGIEEMPVVTGFKNMNELRTIMGRYIYRKTAVDVGLQIPEKDEHSHYVAMTPEQESVYSDLRALGMNQKAKDSGEAHIFSLMDKMSKASMDLSLLDPEKYAKADSPKYASIVKHVKEGVAEGGQVIFADQVDVHQKLKAQLIKSGIKEDQIGIINAQVCKDSAKRQNVADDFVSGKLKVVIGNTATMGEGVNLQKFTTDIHHADQPWEPASIQQRNGRGIRQGNKLKSVRVHNYFAKKSFDGYRYQTVAGKRDWMDQLWHGADRLENLSAKGLNISRDDFTIMMADDPDKARVELAKNKDAQLEKYKAVKQDEAISKFRMLMHLKRNHAALENKETKSAAMLHYRVQKMTDELKSDAHFLHKDLLNESRPILMTKTSLPIFQGGIYEMSAKDDAPAKMGKHAMWRVTAVDLDKQEVTMRPVGHISISVHANDDYTCKVDELSTGMKMGKAVTQHEELKMAIASMRHPSGLASYPEALIADMEPEIQERLRTMMAAPKEQDYSKPYGEQRKELWTISASGTMQKLFPGHKEDAEAATFILPTSKYMPNLVKRVVEEKDDALRYGGSYGGRRKHSSASSYYANALNEIVGWEKAHALVVEYRKQAKQSRESGKVFTPQDFKSQIVLSKARVTLKFKESANG